MRASSSARKMVPWSWSSSWPSSSSSSGLRLVVGVEPVVTAGNIIARTPTGILYIRSPRNCRIVRLPLHKDGLPNCVLCVAAARVVVPVLGKAQQRATYSVEHRVNLRFFNRSFCLVFAASSSSSSSSALVFFFYISSFTFPAFVFAAACSTRARSIPCVPITKKTEPRGFGFTAPGACWVCREQGK